MNPRLAQLQQVWPKWRPLAQQAVLVVALAASLGWQWADPQAHRLPQLLQQAQQLEQQIGAATRQAHAQAQQGSDSASLADQATSLRQRYWHAGQAQQWLIHVPHQARAAGVSLLDWRTLPAPPAPPDAPGAAAAAQLPAPLQVRMQLQGPQTALIRWFAQQVDALPAVQVLDWHWQAQTGADAALGQLTVLWSLPLRHDPPDEAQDPGEAWIEALARPTRSRLPPPLEPEQTLRPSPPPAQEDAAGATHHWPGAELSQLHFVGIWLGADRHSPAALLSHAPPESAASAQPTPVPAPPLMGSVRIGDVLGAPRARVTDIGEGGLTWRSGDAQGQLLPAAPSASSSPARLARP